MHVAFDQFDLCGDDAPYVSAESPAKAAGPARAAPAALPAWQHGGGYGAARLRPGTIAAIVVAHVAALAALIQFDVIAVRKPAPKPLVVTLMAEPPAPPPIAAPEQQLEPIVPVKPQIVAPPPLVAVPQPAPVQIVTVAAPPPQATVVAPAAAAPSAAPATIVPPDGSAASLKNPAPRYPIESRRKREEGTVRLRVVITTEGRVKDIAVARSSGFDRLDDAALDTVRKWKFKAGTLAGVAVEAVGFLSIPFKIAA